VAIQFNKPYLVGTEFDRMGEAIEASHLSGNGRFANRCCELLESELGAPRVLLTHSATGALEMAAILAEISPGDEVVMPSFTFPSTANAFVLRGGVPVFVDIREDTLNIDETLLADAITDRTKAVVPVHYAGVGCEMDAIGDLAAQHGLFVIEDAAQGIGASWRDRPLGTVGELGALSFHESKNVVCGEGGALIVNDPSLIERAELIHEKGTTRTAFFRGETPEYTWVDVGSSFVASDLAAAFLSAQLEQVAEITAARLSIWNRYHAGFADLERQGRIRRPVIPEHAAHNAQSYYLLLEDRADRDRLIEGLKREGIVSLFHYVPLHSSPGGQRFGRTAGGMEVTESAGERLLRVPLWVGLSEPEVDEVIEGVTRLLGA
jgi:dTDP-4-amino-4,6-dideoxygalactose transaminase